MIDNIENKSEHEEWLDIARAIACFFVVAGHLFQSFVKSGVIPNTVLFQWFNNTIYYFHVPVFFLISGYLYQRKLEKVPKEKILFERIINLLVPYLTFSVITYLMKIIANSSINSSVGHSLLYTLTLTPLSPYWFLYILIICDIVFFKLHNKNIALSLFVVLLIAKLINIKEIEISSLIDSFMANGIYFFLGMYVYWKRKSFIFKNKYCLISILFLPLSVIRIYCNLYLLDVCLYFLGVVMILSIATHIHSKRLKLNQYFIPIFVLHTIIAAAVRILLIKFRVTNPYIHIILGGVTSFAVPVIIAKLTAKSGILNFFFYPVQTIKKMKKED